MTPRDFCYWLQGAFEVGKPQELTPEQLEEIRRHLAMVFVHMDAQDPPAVAKAAQAAHDGEKFSRPPGMRC